ncbi:ABC transporter ATP-binding protein [Paenibacillus albus]|uniref:ABC transporter ATP-binding protein n=1 Tax=Paenibacillus albus TaxID=2495582 RepID=A0A3Q8X6U5_9BACL|nr:ABC transporter ATP-binding protein [Paenibacillus albus]AZN41790.1 ABC transporter ATP-binding protein [Paenibacillus albus]
MNNNAMGSAFRGSVLLLYRIFRYIPVLTLIWLSIPILLGALVVTGYSAERQLIDVFMSNHSTPAWGGLLKSAWPFLLLFTGTAVLRSLLNALQNVTDTKLRDQASRSIQSEVHARAAAVPLERLDQPEYYDKLNRAESVAGGDLFGVLQNLITVVRYLCELIGCLTVTTLCHPLLAVILAIAFTVSFAIRLESDLVKRRLNRDLTRSGREADYLSGMLRRSETVRDMRITGSMSYLIAKWGSVMQSSLGLRMNANRREIRRGMIVSTIQIIGIVAAMVWMVLRMKAGGLSAGSFVVVFQAIRQAYGLSGRMAFPVGKVYIQSAKMIDLVQFLKERPASGSELRSNKPVTLPKTGHIGQIKFEHVSYHYPGHDKTILQDIHLTLTPGETVALVGENGAGKSTLVKLLLGLYAPTTGRITWDGVDLQELDPVSLRRAMSAVFQDFVRYETTLRDNVGFGLPEDMISDERIRTAMQSSRTEAIERQPDGLDLRVGLLAEGGRELSGGQWQRLAISRAALRDAQLLVLDEPTSALDPHHETELYHTFRQLAKDRTVLFVSHRLGWARYADHIVVLREGQIVEEGTHMKLMAANGEYAAMFRAQAEWYQEEAGAS